MADSPDEKRVCRDDGRTYTFDEFELEYCSLYSSADLDAAWGAMSPVGQESTLDLTVPLAAAVSRSIPSRLPEPSVIDPGIVELAERGDVGALSERLRAGCSPDVIAFEYRRYPGSLRVFCNDWTPLTAAAVAGRVEAVHALLEFRADANVVCAAITASGSYNFWTALDCARTGETIPFERDPSKHLQPRQPAIEKALLEAGARPASELPGPTEVNVMPNLPEKAERPNPCLDEQGQSYKPPHLFSEAELEQMRSGKAVTKLVRGAKCGMASIGQDGVEGRNAPREYRGGCKVYRKPGAT